MLFIKNNQLYLLENGNITEFSGTEKFSYIIFSDSYFFYDVVEVAKNLPYRKIKKIIYNQLLLNYPERFIEDFYFVNIGDKFVVLLPNKDFLEFIAERKSLIQKAKAYSTPKLEMLGENNVDEIFNIEEDQGLNKIEIPKHTFSAVKKYQNLAQFLFPATLIFIAYILFLIGNIYQLKPLKNSLLNLNNTLYSIYSKVGVEESSDPYGMLLYKASKNNTSGKVSVLKLLDEISKAIKNKAKLKDLKFTNNTVIFDGSCSGFGVLDNIKNNLAKYTKAKVDILSSTMKKGKVLFSIRLML